MAEPSSPAAPHYPVAQTIARLHTWIDEVPPPQRRLGLFIVVALLAQVAAFFFVSIDNAQPEMRHTVRTEVTLDDAQLSGSPEAPTEAYWDQLTDPRLYVLPPRDDSPSGPANPFETGDIHPVDMPAPAQIGSFPFLNQPLPSLGRRVTQSLQPAREPFTYRETPPPMARSTTWRWGPVLAARLPMRPPALSSPVSDTELMPTRLRVAVDSNGTVSDVMLDQSSQNPVLDQEAIEAARKVRFHPVDQPGVDWGFVTVAWYYTPKPPEVAPPSAPLAP